MRGSWTIGRKLYTGIGAMVILLLGAGGESWWIATSLKGELDAAAKENARRFELSLNVASDAGTVQSAERRLLIAAYRRDLTQIDAARKEVADELRDFQRVELHAVVIAEVGHLLLGALDGLVDQLLQLVVFDHHGVHAHAGLELDLIDGMQVRGIGDTQEQPFAAPEHRQAAVFGQQLVSDQPRGFQIDPAGKYLLAAGQKSNGLSVYEIHRDSGVLRKISRLELGKNPNWVEIVNLP